MSIILLSFSLSILSSTSSSHPPDLARGDTERDMPVCAIICQQYYDKDPHGDDPHGRDPHDERHELALPANGHDNDRVATDDVYGGGKPVNSQHPLDNFPGKAGF